MKLETPPSSQMSAKSPMRKTMNLAYAAGFRLAGKMSACSSEDTIVIAGAPRSGTTLIQEALQELPGYKALNEPLLKKETQRRYGFTSRPYFAPGSQAPTQENFLRRALTGQLGPEARWALPPGSRWKALSFHSRRNKLIVKFCRINRSLEWFAERFHTRGIVFVVRHPCSVVSSMLRFGQWTRPFAGTHHEPDSPLWLNGLPDATQAVFEPIVRKIKSQAEALAAIWCLDHYLPLVQSEKRPWTLLVYEKLVRHGPNELERIGSALRVPINDRMRAALVRPSSSVKGRFESEASRQLSKWKYQLTSDQIDGVLRVVSMAGLDRFYSADIDPDYAAFDAPRQSASGQVEGGAAVA